MFDKENKVNYGMIMQLNSLTIKTVIAKIMPGMEYELTWEDYMIF